MNEPRQTKQDEPKRPFDAGDAEAVRGREKLTKESERRRVNGLKVIVENEDARAWLWELLGFCGIARSSFTGNSETFFREGQRNVGLRIQAELVKHHPEKYITMMKEGEKHAAP